MGIYLMTQEHFEDIAVIDQVAYDKKIRPLKNLAAMRSAFKECCYVTKLDDAVTGFSFSKKQGEEAFIGPIAVLPKYQSQGFGTLLLNKSIEYLKQRAAVIGLEVRPLKTNNISLYGSLNFKTAFPTFNYELKDFEYQNRFFEIVEIDIDNKEHIALFEKIEKWLNDEFKLSYISDFAACLTAGGKMLAALSGGLPVGFLVCGGFLSPHVWGAIKRFGEQTDALKALLKAAASYFGSNVLIGVNTRYYQAVKLMTELHFNINFVMNRMFLDGYEGRFFELDDGISLRSWIG